MTMTLDRANAILGRPDKLIKVACRLVFAHGSGISEAEARERIVAALANGIELSLNERLPLGGLERAPFGVNKNTVAVNAQVVFEDSGT